MPRPTREVRELREEIAELQSHKRVSLQIEAGLRRDLEGASRSIKNLHDIVARAEAESREHEKAAHDAQSHYRSRYLTLLSKHQQVCVMWAEMVAQFDEVGVVAKDKEMSA